MRLRLTLTLAEDAHQTIQGHPALLEVEVQAPAGSTARELAQALATRFAPALSARPEPHLAVAGDPVPPDAFVGRAPLVDGVAATLWQGRPPGRGARPRQRGPAVLAVTHGPDAGGSLELTGGRYTIGRSPDADLQLADPLLSRVHAELVVANDRITVRDVGSTNGTRVAGNQTSESDHGATATPVTSGTAIRLGESQLLVRPTRNTPATSTATADGTRMVNPRPRVRLDPEEAAIELPAPPSRAESRSLPWVAVAVPIPVAAVMAFFFGPMMLAFALMAPVLMVGSHLGDRLGVRRRYAEEVAEHARHLASAQARVAAACEQEARSRRSSLPDPAAVLDISTDATARLWERRRGDHDTLTVSIGTCSAPANLRLTRATGGLLEPPELRGVPCAIELAALGVFGVCGPEDVRSGALRPMIGQLAVLHSPRDLTFVLLASTPSALDQWHWMSRLPHLRNADGSSATERVAVLGTEPGAMESRVRSLASVVAHRHEHRMASEPWGGPWTVVVLDGSAALRRVPGLADVLERGAKVGVVTIALDVDATALPTETRGLLDLTRPFAPVLHLSGHRHHDLVVDRVGPWWSDRLSRGLAPLRDATPTTSEGELPGSTTVAQLLDCATDPVSIARGWTERRRDMAVPVGATTRGAWQLDLATDGPHMLVGGTTGSGKSEFLRSLVISLAIHHPPDEVSFVLVDYKGGAAFREYGELPHTTGVVTDLDDHLARRALVSLTAELKRRELLFAEAGVGDYTAFRSAGGASMPRLVIVIDEFRALAEELPSFVDGMVRIAALGRSLGVHLVLATQRPAGVVTADIKANVNLRVALRVRDRADSDDVLEAPDAAAIDPAHPGRGLARIGGGDLVAFQSAHTAAPPPRPEPAGIQVRLLDWTRAAPEPRPADGPSPALRELTALIASIREAARISGAHAGPSAWLPSLPARLTTAELTQPDSLRRSAIGLIDRPEHQVQEPLELDLDGPGQWAVVGSVGSGRTTALRTIAALATSRQNASELHLYAVSAGGLAALAALPHCGGHVPHDDLGRLERLIERLTAAMTAHRTTSEGLPAVLLLVDDWELLTARTDSFEGQALAERLLAVIREGDGVGLRAVVAGDRGLLSGRAATTLTQRLLLRTGDRTDALLAGVPAHSLPDDPGPGRGVWHDGSEVQLARASELSPLVCTDSEERLPVPLVALPASVTLNGLLSGVGGPTHAIGADAEVERSGGVVLLGVGGDEGAPVGLSPARDGRRWLVAGPSGSGVSTALATVAFSLARAGRPVAVVTMRAGPLDGIRGVAGIQASSDGTDIEALVCARQTHPDLCVVVDAADELLDTPVEPVLREVNRLVDRDAGLLVVGANSSSLATHYRGTAIEVARHRTGLLLRPTSITDADVFGLRVRVDRQAPPGRGHLVTRAGALPVQVAQATPPSAG